MATARPVVLGVLGESAVLLGAAGAGIVVAPENAVALAEAVAALANDAQRAQEMGRLGRKFMEEHLDRDKLAAEMLNELRLVASARAIA